MNGGRALNSDEKPTGSLVNVCRICDYVRILFQFDERWKRTADVLQRRPLIETIDHSCVSIEHRCGRESSGKSLIIGENRHRLGEAYRADYNHNWKFEGGYYVGRSRLQTQKQQ